MAWIGLGVAAATLVLSMLWHHQDQRDVKRAQATADAAAAAQRRLADREPWSVEWEVGVARWMNQTGEDVHDVLIELDDPWYFSDDPDGIDDGRTLDNAVVRHDLVEAGASRVHVVVADAQLDIDTLARVSWTDGEGQRRAWTYPIFWGVR